MTTNSGLWNRLSAFQLDAPSADYRFTDRLAHENGWSQFFARRAVEEYKKFVYLATMVAAAAAVAAAAPNAPAAP